MTSLSSMIALLAVRCGAASLFSAVDPIRALQVLFDPYRPELHYMRGPGPKWHAKHDPASVLR